MCSREMCAPSWDRSARFLIFTVREFPSGNFQRSTGWEEMKERERSEIQREGKPHFEEGLRHARWQRVAESREIEKNSLLTLGNVSSGSHRRTLNVPRDVINFVPPFLRKMILVLLGNVVKIALLGIIKIYEWIDQLLSRHLLQFPGIN